MKTKVSLKITSLIVLLLITLPLGVYISLFTLSKLHDDAMMVNNIGFIRGSTQRLSHDNTLFQKQTIIYDIEDKFNKIDENYLSENHTYLPTGDFSGHYAQLKQYWKDLKTGVLQDKNIEQLYQIQKACWESADKTANAASAIAEVKHKRLVYTLTSISLINFILLSIALFLIYTEVKNKLEVNVLQDPLTQLYNRTHLFHELKSRIKSFERSPHPFSIIFIDIDHFKEINDTYGHHIGDTILQGFASIMKESLRDEDSAFRYGGEEFIILARFSDSSQAHKLCERLRQRIEDHNFGLIRPITISLGLCEYSEGCKIDTLISHADNAMYRAKRQGRNQTCVYHP